MRPVPAGFEPAVFGFEALNTTNWQTGVTIHESAYQHWGTRRRAVHRPPLTLSDCCWTRTGASGSKPRLLLSPVAWPSPSRETTPLVVCAKRDGRATSLGGLMASRFDPLRFVAKLGVVRGGGAGDARRSWYRLSVPGQRLIGLTLALSACCISPTDETAGGSTSGAQTSGGTGTSSTTSTTGSTSAGSGTTSTLGTSGASGGTTTGSTSGCPSPCPNGTCCAAGSACIDDSCCPMAQACGDVCCEPSATCVNQQCQAGSSSGTTGSSCPVQCPSGLCCTAGDQCINESCCPAAQACGTVCCTATSSCVNAQCT